MYTRPKTVTHLSTNRAQRRVTLSGDKRCYRYAKRPTVLTMWQAIAFGRGDRAFIVINNEDFAVTERLHTGLAGGQYCDVISCDHNSPPCGNTGGHCRPTIDVDDDGFALFHVPSGQDSIIAIHR